MKPGGSDGGTGLFLAGFGLLLAAVALYLFFDSVRVVTDGRGMVSGAVGIGRGGLGTTSMGILFIPFFVGVAALFYDASLRWAWVLLWIGLAVIVIEVFSRMRFVLDMKTTHLLLVITAFASGIGLFLRSLRADRGASEDGGETEERSVGK